MPISAAWRSAPRRWRSARRSPQRAKPASRPSSRCAIRRRTRTIGAIAVVSPCGTCRELICGLRSQGARDRARARRSARSVDDCASCCRTNTAASEELTMSTTPRRLVTAERRDEDTAETSLRPQKLAEFIGQEQARANLTVFIEAARARNEALDHVLFVGPPGLGKTTLAQIVVARTRRQLPRHLRAGDRQGRRSRGAAHQSRRARRAVHRRDPPAQSGGRGNPLSGDGGFPARPHHRRGAGGALGEDRSRRSSRWSARRRARGC